MTDTLTLSFSHREREPETVSPVLTPSPASRERVGVRVVLLKADR